MQVYNIYQHFLEDGRKISKILQHLKESYFDWIIRQKEIIQAHVSYSHQHSLFRKSENVFFYWDQRFI